MKKNKLYIKWSQKENAPVYGGVSKQDGALLAWLFEGYKYPDSKTILKELEDRGYDINTIRFSIEKKC